MNQKAYYGNEPYIFASFDRRDGARVLPIIEAIQARGFRVWYYTDEVLSADQQEDIAIYLDNCNVFVSFVSQNSLESQSFRQELNFGIELNKERLIIYLEDVKLSLGMQMRLGFVQNMYYSRHKTIDSFLDELCRSNVLMPCRDTNGYVTAEEAYRKGMLSYECGRYEEAVKWLQKSAEQGQVDAQFQLSRCYEMGRGVGKNLALSVKWLRMAAEQGHEHAQCNLGNAYFNAIGVQKNDGEALLWYSKAAEQGNVDAICGLGIVYCYGQGVQNPMEAVRYFQKAARLGSSYAQDILGDLGLPW